MANLKFRYTHDNPYNEDMERILNKWNFREGEDDDEGIEYEGEFEVGSDIGAAIIDYFDFDDANLDGVISFKVLPYSKYGWGFSEDVMILPLNERGYEQDELYIPTEDFIDIFS